MSTVSRAICMDIPWDAVRISRPFPKVAEILTSTGSRSPYLSSYSVIHPGNLPKSLLLSTLHTAEMPVASKAWP